MLKVFLILPACALCSFYIVKFKKKKRLHVSAVVLELCPPVTEFFCILNPFVSLLFLPFNERYVEFLFLFVFMIIPGFLNAF